MDVQRLASIGSRICGVAAALLLVTAFAEMVLELLKVYIPKAIPAGRLVEIGAMLLVPVAVVLLREIREELRAQKRA
jgi:hypothetical protein